MSARGGSGRRYAAFLRGVMPTNCKMPELKHSFETAGFTDVKTVLVSGNVVFSAREAAVSAIEKKAEAAMEKELGRAFMTIVRPIEALQTILAADPYAAFRLPPAAKRIVTFLRQLPACHWPKLDRTSGRPTSYPVAAGDGPLKVAVHLR